MVTATPLKFDVENETTQLTVPITFSPPIAKKMEKPQNMQVSPGTVSTSMTLFKVVIGIFLLLRFVTRRSLFSFRKTSAARKPKNSKQRTRHSRLRSLRKLNVPPIKSPLTT